MIVFRLGKSKYAQDLSGKGAEMSGGRWNSKGTALLYTSQSRALCTVEIAVHTPLGNVPVDYTIVTIEIPDELPVHELAENELPADWNVFPHSHSTQEIGDKFSAAGSYPILKVPSAIIQGDFNYLINPRHPDNKKINVIKAEPFSFDTRLFLK